MDLVQIEGKQPGASDFVEKQIQNYFLINLYWSIFALASPGAQRLKNLLAMKEMQIQSLGGEDPLEKGRQPTPVFLSGDSRELRRLVGYSSVQFNHSVVSDSLRPHESQHARPPCSSQTTGVHPNPRPSSR